ncbi:hypothetical protein GCM10011519_31070 [Marmoricola endophyticus]|uniref:Bacterial bifunctional deaminase-reductase C-terminal domain-containing protein n=1 Tax=Marmoricola endophyticus TaxID=2040280 RepID=A0A917BQG1_9ACTN|nr:dihydrofolate reductase family protein [Marmoricola endophyticus]GGF54912.1 hypothetical protein GCM10011519_31070 [Marmoricola endophyticus]
MLLGGDGPDDALGTDLDAGRIRDAYPWPDEGRWVRAMMVTTLDGAAGGPDGLSGSISSGADREVFGAVRRLADAVLIGAGTMRAERYGPMTADPSDAERREADGQAPAPRLCVLSGTLDLPWGEDVWSHSTLTPLVLTGGDAPEEALSAAREHVEVCVLDELSPATLLDTLEQRGLRRVVCEGGPGLLSAMVEAGLLDEADITLSPVFAGGTVPSSGPEMGSVHGFALRHVLTGEDCLMMRYVREGA